MWLKMFLLFDTEMVKFREIWAPRSIVHEAAKNGDRSENGDYIYGKRRLREIDSRVRYLTKTHWKRHYCWR